MKQIIKLVILSLISVPTLAIAEDPAKDKEKQPPAPSEYLTKFAPFKITVELDGFFAPTKEHKISLTPKAWTDMTIVTAMQHGQDVKKGDKILFSKYGGNELSIGGEDLLILEETDVLAVIG